MSRIKEAFLGERKLRLEEMRQKTEAKKEELRLRRKTAALMREVKGLSLMKELMKTLGHNVGLDEFHNKPSQKEIYVSWYHGESLSLYSGVSLVADGEEDTIYVKVGGREDLERKIPRELFSQKGYLKEKIITAAEESIVHPSPEVSIHPPLL